ncbi:hypothetical protein V1639_04115 [Pseudarthrobacter sp. J75]|uniref:hypothetical protein n=1 Tax=unclassified Pseudarthrobacter TaxID=2647000 RepID=UPI002E817F11|nr:MULTISPECIES: hypothetical protein [unclassified Pseudarthrobacter]MEE2522137.1 hypothetical protein [Pseudarthrobacter sp. J47]MEE2528217.1 hypothetical protein [Pseudarthrobacter sp. J75]
MNSPVEQRDLILDVFGTQFVVAWGSGVTSAQAADLGSAWSRCVNPAPLLNGIRAEEGTDAKPFTACLTRVDGESVGSHLQVAAGSFEELAELISSYLTLRAIDAQAGKLTMLHACGIADPESGRVLALVAKSGTGKTTASRILGQSFGYVTDETIAIQPDGVVRAYPKPLSIKNGGLFKEQVSPDGLGLLEAPDAVHIHGIALLNRRHDWKGEPLVEKVPLVDAVLALIPDTSSQGRIERPLQSLCRLIDRVGGVWRVEYSEAEDLTGALAHLFEPREPDDAGWSAPPPAAAFGEVPPGYYVRLNPQDVVEIDGELILLTGAEVVRLSGIAPTIWELAGAPVTMDGIVRGLETRHGLPENYQLLVDAAISEMTAKRLIRLERS